MINILFRVTPASASGIDGRRQYAEMPSVPRVGDAVELFGQTDRVKEVIWTPTSPLQHVVIILGN